MEDIREEVYLIMNRLSADKISIKPKENPNYVPSFLILNWQAGTCGYRLIPNANQTEEDDGIERDK